MAKKIFVTLFILAAIVAVILGIKQSKQQKPVVKNEPKKEEQAKPKVMPDLGKTIEVAPEKLPLNFPADFPSEKGAEIVNNSIYSPNDKTQASQSTREYLSAKTPQENFNLYQTYLKKNKWEIAGSLDKPDTKILNAQKGEFRLNIHLTVDAKTQKTLVSAYLIYK